MNKKVKNIFLILLLLTFMLGFSQAYTSYNLDKLAFVTALGFDVSDNDPNKIRVTFQFAFSSASGGSESSGSEGANQTQTSISSVEANSIDEAINLMKAHIGKELKLSHCKMIIFSEELAQNGIQDIVYTLVNNIQIRPTSNIVVSKCNTQYYLEHSKPSLETYVTSYYENFPNSSKYNGYTADATIGNFFYALNTKTCEPYAILGGVESKDSNNTDLNTTKSGNTSIKSSRKSENLGLAVFCGDKLFGELSVLDTLCFSLIKNDISNFMVSVPSPYTSDKLIDINLYADSALSSSLSIVNDTPYIKINAKYTGAISSMSDNCDYLNKETLNKISTSVNKYLESSISSYLYRTSKDYKADINCFGKKALSKFLTALDFKNYKWEEKYKDAFFDVHVETNIKSGYLLTQT